MRQAWELDPAVDPETWVQQGWEAGWSINGMDFVLGDETCAWALVAIVDAQVWLAPEDYVGALFGDVDEAGRQVQVFRRDFDREGILPSFRRMAREARIPEAPA